MGLWGENTTGPRLGGGGHRLTAEQREAEFQAFLQREAEALAGAKPAPLPDGAEAPEAIPPWHGGSIERRREVWMRRYDRPAAVVW